MQRLESFEGEAKKRFMLHYNFPPFSVGEVAFLRGAGRREIGHGALAERAVAAVLPVGRRLAVRDARRLRHSGVERFVVDGHRLRRSAVADGRGRSAQGSGRRRGDGPGEGRRQVRHPDRHRRRRRSLRRHGLQSRRHAQRALPRCRWTSRSAASRAQIMREAMEQARRGRLFILDKMDEVLAGAAHQAFGVCAAHLHPADSDRQDSRPDRAGRQDDSRHHRADRREDRRGGLRPGERCLERRGRAAEGACR